MGSSFLKRTSLFVMMLAMLAGAIQADDLAEIRDVYKKSFKVRPGGILYLDISHGNIDVVTRRGSEVLVEVETIVDTDDRDEARRMLEDYQISSEQRGNNVYVQSRIGREGTGRNRMFWRGNSRIKVRIQVEVPEQYNVTFTSGAGNVAIRRLDGEVNGKTGAGNIFLGVISGDIRVQSGTGNIEVDGAGSRVEVHTGAGNLKLAEIRGEVMANTGAGNIDAEITRQPRSASNLTTGAGNIVVEIGGRVGLQVDATSALGSASTDFPLRVEGRWMKKSFSGEVNGGGPMLVMRAGVGNVELKKQ